MGKEYITDTVTLRGDITFNEKTQTQSRITQINYESLEFDKAGFLTQNALASQTTFNETFLGASPETTISLGGFVDSESEVINLGEKTATKIKIYTGEIPSKMSVIYYEGKERFTIDKRGHVGINNTDIDRDKVTFDVRSTIATSTNSELPPRLQTPSIAITHPYYNYEGSREPTPQYIGRLQFRSIQNPDEEQFADAPTDMAAIQVETDGQANIYKDPRVNITLNTNTGEKGSVARPALIKHLEINGYENKTKIFTQLNLGKVPVFETEKAALASGLVSGDVWQDSFRNLKIIFGEQENDVKEEPRGVK